MIESLFSKLYGGDRNDSAKPAGKPIEKDDVPASDLAAAGARQADEQQRTLEQRVRLNRTQLESANASLAALDATFGELRYPGGSGISDVSVSEVLVGEVAPLTTASAHPTNEVAAELVDDDASAEPPPIAVDEAVLQQLIRLLQDGQIEDFNNIRPAGRIDLHGVDFSGMNLRGVDLRYADLTRAILQGADLSEAKLQRAILDRADLSETTLTQAELFRTSLRYADMRRVRSATAADFRHANLSGAELNEGDFSSAYFRNASLITSSLIGAKFIAAQMEDAAFAGACLSEASFERANLTRARFFQSNGEDINFSGANLCDAEAVQTFFSSTNAPSGEDKVSKTTFEGAWVSGFQRDGSFRSELLAGSIADRYPPEGTFDVAPDPKDEKILVDGIPGTDKVIYDAALAELNDMVGITEVKKFIRDLLSLLKAGRNRELHGLPKLDLTLHAIFTGPPGTGKTTVARIQSKLLCALGYLRKGHLVETDKSGMIAGYAGQTLGKTNEKIDEALDGTLLIDEAYALAHSDDDAYAKDATVVLTKRLEDDRKRFCCIACGYPEPMERFRELNPGLSQRFPNTVEFPGYSSGDLIEIMQRDLNKKKTQVDNEFRATASVLLAALQAQQGEHFSNGRAVRTMVEQMQKTHASRLDAAGLLGDRDELMSPAAMDLPFDSMLKLPRSVLPPLEELRWRDDDGREYSFAELPLEGLFPSLTNESAERIAEATLRPSPSSP